jgi:hypothetical protein
MLLFTNVTASVTHFIALEVLNLIEMLVGIGFLTASWPGAAIAMFGMEMIIYVAVETCRAVKPRAGANEYATGKPLRTVVAVGGAVVRGDVIVSVGTFGRDTDVDLYLSLCFGSGYREADCSHSN